jgi:hypothetical protein
LDTEDEGIFEIFAETLGCPAQDVKGDYVMI